MSDNAWRWPVSSLSTRIQRERRNFSFELAVGNPCSFNHNASVADVQGLINQAIHPTLPPFLHW